MKKCIYCGTKISGKSVIDFCKICGENIWGDKMFSAIVQNMEDARNKGDLCLEHEIPENQVKDL